MLQGGEIIIILLLALVVLGPQRLPDLARKLGGWTAELRSAARDIRRGLESEVAGLKEIGDDLKAVGDEVKAVGREVAKPLDEAGQTARHVWTGPKPVSGPTPEDAMRDLEQMQEGVPGEEEEA